MKKATSHWTRALLFGVLFGALMCVPATAQSGPPTRGGDPCTRVYLSQFEIELSENIRVVIDVYDCFSFTNGDCCATVEING